MIVTTRTTLTQDRPSVQATRWCELLLALSCTCLALLALSCRPETEATAAGTPNGIEERVVRGPLSVCIKVDRKEITLADRLTFTIEVEAPEDYEVELPAFGQKLEQFLIKDAITDEPVLLEGERLRIVRRYTLEPVVSGDYPIEPMNVHFALKGDPEGKTHDVETPETTITVTSLLPEDVAALDVADIIPPQDIPRPSLAWLWIAAGVLLALGLVTALVVHRLRRRTAIAAAPRRPAHDIAYESLRLLVAEDLIGQGRTKEFYRRISTILRVYIENRFELRAPERTTEEFLTELAQNDALNPGHKALLREFLTHCDLVKFAELVPDAPQIQATFDSTKAFIEQTRNDPGTSAKGGEAS